MLSKIWEYFILEGFHLLPDHQFAHCKGLRTTDAFLISNELQSVPDHGQEAWVVQLELSTVFDYVNHEGLLYLLKTFGDGESVPSSSPCGCGWLL